MKRRMRIVPVLSILAAAAAVWAGLAFSGRFPEIGKRINPFAPRTASHSIPVLMDMTGILELQTVEYVYKSVFPFDYIPAGIDWPQLLERHRSGGPLSAEERESLEVYELCREAGIDLAAGRNEFVVITSIVRGGFDLSAGQDPEGEPVRPSGTVLYVWLPEPVILDVIVEDSRSADYGYPDIVLRPESWKRVVEFVRGHVVGEVIEDGILETARENGKEALRGIFRGAGWEDVIFL